LRCYAWRAELAATSLHDVLLDLATTVPASVLVAGAEWVQQVEIDRGSRRTAAL
jgi:hypothetical protein